MCGIDTETFYRNLPNSRDATHRAGPLRLASRVLLLLIAINFCGVAFADPNLVKNSSFAPAPVPPQLPAEYAMSGNANYRYLADSHRAVANWGVVFDSATSTGIGLPHGEIWQMISNLQGSKARWFRFSFRGLPQDNFSVGDNGLYMRVDFFSKGSGFDGKVKRIYPIVQQQRKDFAVNGDNHHGGAATWHTYQLDFLLPNSQVDSIRLAVGFDHGNAATNVQSQFFVTGFSLIPIDGPTPETVGDANPTQQRPANLIAIGGRWFYKADAEHAAVPKLFDASNVDRLIYHDNVWSAPFAGCTTAYLRAGEKDLNGNIAEHDTLVADNVTIAFDSTSMIIHTHGLPNHPTGKFPQEGFGNPNYIQEQDATYYIPLNPKENPQHVVTTTNNSNHALNMGPIGVAINGVVFFNPFDTGNSDATSLMDYCCGHPNQDGLYHYHKYPICINSPWADEGNGHSPLIGWAFDGFPIYGPYVRAGVLAKDAAGADALNAFNMHYDAERGWHYQVTPGKFPYIIGGYWGTADRRDVGPPGGRGRRGMGLPPPPPGFELPF